MCSKDNLVTKKAATTTSVPFSLLDLGNTMACYLLLCFKILAVANTILFCILKSFSMECRTFVLLLSERITAQRGTRTHLNCSSACSAIMLEATTWNILRLLLGRVEKAGAGFYRGAGFHQPAWSLGWQWWLYMALLASSSLWLGLLFCASACCWKIRTHNTGCAPGTWLV